MHSIESIRKALRKQIPHSAGKDGEEYAKQWLSKSGWNFEEIEQGKFSLSNELRVYGGKRPDFIVDPNDGSFLLIDAKYHSTEDCSLFNLKDTEIGKYRALVKYTKDNFPDIQVDMLFMVFPKERDGKKLVWVHLDEFNNGETATVAGEAATSISLKDRDDLWCQNA
ncbi:hypothetical protein [Pseudoalteromonas sp.]|uniref:hypothetical protein n=1 Tax=Pseudoalteromonas sp. TaxID=53249 RepID=UPI003564F144